MRVRNMTEGSPIRLILAVAFPLMLGNIFQQLYTVVDAQIVGSVVGVSALAAVGAADWFNWLFLGGVQGLAQGFAIPMAQAFGAGDHAKLRRCVGNAVVLAVITSVVITLLALALISPVLTMMSTPDEIRPMSTTYLIILFAGLPVVMGYNLTAGILRSLGDGRSPLYAMVVAAVLNIGLDYLFVAGFGWGVGGAAFATILAQAFSCLFCLQRLSKISLIHPSAADLRPDSAICVQLMRLGTPIALQNVIIGVGGMVVQSIVNPLGVAFIAGYTASNKLYGVLEVAAISYGYSVSTYTGQNLGAQKPVRIRKGVHAAAITGVLTAGIITGLMFLFGRSIIGSFISGTPDEIAAATQVGWEFLCLMSVMLPILYLLHIYRSALQGMGNTVMPMMSGLAEFFMRTGAAFLLPGLIGYQGVFWAEILAWIGADLILLPSYYADLKKVSARLSSLSLQSRPQPL